MKAKIFILVILVAFATDALFSQDIILKKDKSEIKAKIIEIQENLIKYKLFDFLDGPLRSISTSDVIVIKYENGRLETFEPVSEIKPVQNQTVPQNQPEKYFQQYSKKENVENSPLGFIIGGKGGFYIPYNQSISEMYGAGFMGGFFLGYWGFHSAIEFDIKYYSKNGEPYIIGSVDNADSRLTLTPATISGYWIPYSKNNLITYIGGGFGVCIIKEEVSMSAFGQTGYDEEKLTGVELHTTGGIKFKPFYLEVNFSSIVVEDYDNVNFGGIVLGFGLFF